MKLKFFVFFISCLVLLSACESEKDTQIKPSLTGEKTLFCGAENITVIDEIATFISNGDSFGLCSNQDSSYAHSGIYSVKLNDKSQKGFSINIENISEGDMIEISVWRRSSCYLDPGYAILYGGSEKVYHDIHSILGRVDEWDLLHDNIHIENGGDNQSFEIYMYSDCEEGTWFDDLEVVIHKKKDQEYSYPNFTDEEKIQIKISNDQLRKLESKRRKAIEFGLLISNSNDYVDGVMIFEGQSFPIEIRLKGDWLDHLKGVKWSFRIKVKKGNFNGLRTFSLHNPNTRGMLNEWFIHQMFEDEGVLTTRYGFVPVELNGISLGVYAWEEHFEKQLLEAKLRREGPILKLNEDPFFELFKLQKEIGVKLSKSNAFLFAEIQAFRQGKTIKNPVLREEFIQAQNLLFQHKKQLVASSELTDIDKLSTYYAISDLGQSIHGVQWHNQRFYYNPLSARLEPIAYDCFSAKPMWQHKNLIGHTAATNFKLKNVPHTLFPSGDLEIVTRYLSTLKKYSEKEFLDSFIERHKEQIRKYETLLQQEFKNYAFHDGQQWYKKQASLSAKIELYENFLIENPVKFEKNESYNIPEGSHPIEPSSGLGLSLYLKDTTKQFTFEAINLHAQKLELLGFGTVVGMTDILKKPLTLEPFSKSGKKYQVKSNTNYYYYRVKGRVKVYMEKANMWSYPVAISARQEYEKRNSIPSSFSKSENELRLKSGSYTFSKNVFIPKGYTIIIEEGVNITIKDNVSFISYSPVHFQGSEENPIVVNSNASSGFSIIGAAGKSSINHTTFQGFDTQDIEGWRLTGAVNFFESDVDISHCQFLDNVCEDGLNIIHSNFTLSNSEISGTFSDGFDADYCTGKVSNCIFKNNGNDCMDFSTSTVEISSCEIIKAGDKGVSGGENSTLIINDLSISDVKIGVASKDQSQITIDGIEMTNCTYGFATFQKKLEYGPASIKVVNAKINNVETLRLIELNSVIDYEGEIIQGTDSLDIDVLYDL